MPSLLRNLRLAVPLLFGNDDTQGGTPAEAYAAAVLATNPLRYNKLNEGSGAAIVDSSGNGYTGSYTGVTWDGTLSPFGEAVPFFDGTNDYGSLYSAAFGTAFNMDEFTVMLWLKMNSAGVWTDGLTRWFATIRRDGNNRVQIGKANGNNSLQIIRVGNATTVQVFPAGHSDTGWFSLAVSCSIAGGGLLSAGDMRFYKNGTELTDSPAVGNVATAGSGLQAASTVIGALSTTPSQVHHGYLSQVAIWNSPMSADKLALMTV